MPKKLLFIGKGKILKYIESSEKMVDFISKNEGAIGFISEKTVINSKVKILSVRKGIIL